MLVSFESHTSIILIWLVGYIAFISNIVNVMNGSLVGLQKQNCKIMLMSCRMTCYVSIAFLFFVFALQYVFPQSSSEEVKNSFLFAFHVWLYILIPLSISLVLRWERSCHR